ncbi:3-oxoacyl-[acyl-carrier protein] reductase [Paenibacillus sp. PvP052]|nr:3-oxoacyl-[acyl-carrier protein] reductase [Paenibacillus sp. PvP052]
MRNNGLLTGKTAIVTGAGTGLGRASALAFAAEGAQVVLCGRRASKIETVAAEITAAGGTALAVQADVSVVEDTLRLVRLALEQFGRVDVLINNAAVFEPGTLSEMTLEAWNEHLAVNLTGPFLMTRAVVPSMRKQKYGRIVNITSGMAESGAGGYIAYSASKAGLESLTRTTAEEESDHHILANLYNPGTIKSEMHATGKDPASVVLELVALASLPEPGFTGRLVQAGELESEIS